MADKLDPQEALKAIENCNVSDQQVVLEYAYNVIKQMIDDYAPVVHGYWTKVTDPYDIYDGVQCSVCERINWGLHNYKYCPHCAVKMENLIRERKELVEIVRCQDCKYRCAYDGDNGMHSDWWCRSLQTFVEEDFYCKDGKRKVDEQQ